MITTIRKRDGREVPFNIEKIANAIFKAAQSCGGKDYGTAFALAQQVAQYLDSRRLSEVPTVEIVQDAVEKILVENGHARTAKEYILYRAERNRIREMDTRLMQLYEDMTFHSAAENDVKRENANINGDTAMGTMYRYGSEGAKRFNELFILSPDHARAHINGDIHIHDMDFYTLTTTCCQIDLKKLFRGGFENAHGQVREPETITSYAALAQIAIECNQNDQHGGQSIPNFDYYMAEGVAKSFARHYQENLQKALELVGGADGAIGIISSQPLSMQNLSAYQDSERKALLSLGISPEDTARVQKFAACHAEEETEKETYQAMEAFLHNMNLINSRAGAQVPFSSINYGTDVSPEGRLATACLLKATEAGIGSGKTSIFPVQIFKVKEGVNFNPGDPNYDLFQLAMKVSAKRLFPNFSFLDAPFNLQYYKPGNPDTECAYMGCRTRVIANNYDPEHEIVTGRGNLSFTSINLPRLAIKAAGNVDAFFESLDQMMDLVIEQLLERFKIQSEKLARNYPFLMGQGVWLGSEKLGPDDPVGEVLKQGTLSVGFIGLAETLKSLTGKHHGESQEAQNLGLEIIGFMRNRVDEAAQRTGLNFSLIGTPAEGLSGRFVKIDRKKYGVIPGVTDREYYTNAFHVPVYYEISAFDKIRREAPYHALTNGGHITYIELDGDPCENLDAFEQVIRCMKESGIGYGSINHPVDRDPVCGFTGIIGEECPQCHRKETPDAPFERIRRITGYLVGTLDRFNDAKRAEVEDRVKHSVGKMEEI
ncbi:MAG TPA: anaerobic ribonucleoside triphosphate reductase [Candidatus Merdivicinus intestinavium]|nr:anaerobic ribonucleoside triphosphate reductase [Candidatus Merdivicinus intestinavium]